jgi:predicted ATP-grasp superfamily ATP-dependent carboligase
MLRAFVSDAVDAGWEVVATWDRRLSIPDELRQSGLELISVDDVEAERVRFAELCRAADAAYVIAPELDGELLRRVTAAQALNHRCLNASISAVDLCGDKWEFFRHCRQGGLPTIETELLRGSSDSQLDWPRVAKLRFGAGSQRMQLLTPDLEWPQCDQTDRHSELLLQPYVSGFAISVAALVGPDQRYELFPVADQFISPQRSFEYSGGRVPSQWDSAVVRQLAGRVMESIPGLSGYVGIDLLIPDSNPTQPIVVEVNPRLTTSYIGYRTLCQENIVRHWLDTRPEPLSWRPNAITFDSQGMIQ